MKKLITIIFLISVAFIFAEKFAIIYTELPELINLKKSYCKYDLMLMEKAWKTTFLKWEDLSQENKYKIGNIYVLYANGIDYSCTIYGTSLDVRYTPWRYGIDHICLQKTPANSDNLDSLTNSIKSKLNKDDELLIFDYNETKNKFIEINSFKEENK